MRDCIGSLAYAKCGRDRKRLFCVVGVLDEDFVLIADGRLHKLAAPKKKRLKHLSFVQTALVPIPDEDGKLHQCITEYELLAANRRDCSAER